MIGPRRAHGAVRTVRKNDDPVELAAIVDRPEDLQLAAEEGMGRVGDADLGGAFMIPISIL
jgi:hypothetical protein